ncbi:MAG: hypothetical protein RLZZ524_1615, partial [Pseudomonadota bacterium]
PGRPQRLIWSDSEVLTLRPVGTRVEIVFSAAAIELKTGPQQADGAAAPARPLHGHVRHLVASLGGAEAHELRDCIGRIRTAHISRGGSRLAGVDVPCRLSGDLEIDIDFANGAAYHSRVETIDFHFTGKADFTESQAC